MASEKIAVTIKPRTGPRTTIKHKYVDEESPEPLKGLGSYICNRCTKRLKTKQSYDYHMKHNVCRKNTCIHCNANFKTAQSYRYHRDNRVCLGARKIPVEIKLNPDGLIRTCKETINYRDIDLDSLIEKEPLLLNKVLNEIPERMVAKFIELVLCNKSYPQYWSMYVTNRNDSTVHIYNQDSDRFDLTQASDTLGPLFVWALEKLSYLCVNHMHLITDEQSETFEKVKVELLKPENTGLSSQAVTNVYLTLYNYRDDMRKKIKTMRTIAKK